MYCSALWKVKKNGYKANGNLPEPDLSKVNYYVQNKTQLPNEGGMLLPFHAELARDDSTTVLRVVDRYFKQLLGSNDGTAVATLHDFKRQWGTLKETRYGDILSHMFAGIDICFQTGCFAKILLTPNSGYNGLALFGGRFALIRGESVYKPVSFDDLQKSYENASPHSSALKAIFDLMTWDDSDDETRDDVIKDMHSITDVAYQLRTRGYDVLSIPELKRNAALLDFRGDESLPITHHNVIRVLNAIKSEDRMEELLLPVHHQAILEMDRTKRLMSAFGVNAPSFRIPGGRLMSLTGNKFEYTQVLSGKGQKKVVREVTTMHIYVTSWAEACKDLAETISSKSVLSPVGTELASRVSTKSMIREYSGDHGVAVLAALRKVCGDLVYEGDGSGSKRKATEQGGSELKKHRTEADDAMSDIEEDDE